MPSTSSSTCTSPISFFVLCRTANGRVKTQRPAAMLLMGPDEKKLTRRNPLDFPISNFATLDEKTGIVISWRANMHFEEEGPILCKALDGMKLPSFLQYEVRVRQSLSHFVATSMVVCLQLFL